MIKILKYGEVENSDIFARVTPTVDVETIVADIIANVRQNGDKALYEYCEKFDKVKLDRLAVSEAELDAAMNEVPADFLRILRVAAETSAAFTKSRSATALS